MSDALSLPELGVQGQLGSALAGDAAACGARRAAGVACFASLVGLWLKNRICLKKKNSKEKKSGGVSVKKGFVVSLWVLGHHRERLGWADELRRAAGWQGDGSSGALTHQPFPRAQEAAREMPLKELLLLL